MQKLNHKTQQAQSDTYRQLSIHKRWRIHNMCERDFKIITLCVEWESFCPIRIYELRAEIRITLVYRETSSTTIHRDLHGNPKMGKKTTGRGLHYRQWIYNTQRITTLSWVDQPRRALRVCCYSYSYGVAYASLTRSLHTWFTHVLLQLFIHIA